ncbi:GTPase Obg/CgtA [Litorimonas cladophorae]|uniref:GTPase Obg n=1 Tax=Litorimonas cladophorae TaxID=1220491 RepID=A0A918KFB7_9PROT|nr:GTPase ObgE [Litorimonas cladophorae]GGX61226.1 GTPase Obg/CgtA [Litorimonas cladophorae]
MKFLDQAKIYVSSGAGGGGSVSFRREKNIAFGGPNGGDGGRGGNIYLEATRSLNTLIDYRYQQHFKAKTGMHGMGLDRHGAAGDDITLKVPVGTQVIDAETDEVLADMTEDGERVLVAQGGNGGWGNARFKSATNQAPRKANPGEDGEERWLWLRLKLIADAGLIGLPNAGKSTFLSTVTAAKPKTADYPFTTLHPHLGVVSMSIADRFIIADLPGLIEGAAEGAGLGHRFLGHAERCAAILHLVPGTSEDPVSEYLTIRKELEDYHESFEDKPEIVAISKCDALTPERIEELQDALESVCGQRPFPISSVAQQGLKPVLSALYQHVERRRAGEEAEREEKRRQEKIAVGAIEDVKGWSP